MRWQIETWRKLYTAKPASWLALPVSARGLGRELLTYCDDRGRIPIGDEPPGPAVSRLLSAHRGEQKRIDSDVAALLKDGYLLHEGDALVIRNFVQAQERSSSAERQQRYRDRQRGGAGKPSPDRNELRNAGTSPVTSHVAQRSDGSRDRSRSEPPYPPPSGGCIVTPQSPEHEPTQPFVAPRANGTNPRANGTNPRAIAAPMPPAAEPSLPPPPRADVAAQAPADRSVLHAAMVSFGRPASPEDPSR